jgi:putative membrane protein
MTRWLILALSMWPLAAWAHPDPTAPPHLHSFPWSFEPWVVTPLVLVLGLYLLGLRRLWRRAAAGRRSLRLRAELFGAGWLLLALPLTSPLHAAGGESFTAHMIEHEILMLAAAPALVAARPLPVMLWAFDARGRNVVGRAMKRLGLVAVGRRLSHLVTATAAQAVALWVWHAPALFDRALAHEGLHVAQHASFIVTALFFWSAVFEARVTRSYLGSAILALFATSVVSGALGAVMAVSISPWYARYAALGLTAFGLTPTEDQQLAGVLMWVPGGLVHAAAALALLGQALTNPKRSQLNA